MCEPRSAQELHARAVHAARDRFPTVLTRTPWPVLRGHVAASAQEISGSLRTQRRARESANQLLGPIRSLADDQIEIADATDFRTRFLRNFQHCFKELMCLTRIKHPLTLTHVEVVQ